MKAKNFSLILGLTVSTALLNAQSDAAGPGGHIGLFPTWYVGWNAATAFPLTIAHKGNQPINFQTNGTQRMTILPTSGFVGIGLPTPGFQLDVNNDMNLFTSTNGYFGRGYRINNAIVLQSPGTSCFVGTNAGQNVLNGNSGITHNTFVGYESGQNAQTQRSTFVGYQSGRVTTGLSNTFMGNLAGENNTTGGSNVFIGSVTGPQNVDGSQNTYVGTSAGFRGVSGDNNVYLGFNSGRSVNNSANNNTFIGTGSNFANPIPGSNNSILGFESRVGAGTDNATALGAKAYALDDNTMILGYNSVNVGIGLSGFDGGVIGYGDGPKNKLEINTDNTTTVQTASTLNAGGGTGFSGLRFRDLTSTSTPYTTNPGTGVLGLDGNGDVIYVPASTGGTSLGNICDAVTTNPLADNWEIPLNNFNFIFKGQGITNNNVGIGTTCSPTAKLQVTQSSTNTGSTAVKVDNTDVLGIGVDVVASGPFAVKGLALSDDQQTGNTIGVHGEANYNSIKGAYGVNGIARNSSKLNAGGRFQAINTDNSPLENMGILCDGRFADVNYGGRFRAEGYNNTSNFGIHAQALGTPGSASCVAIYGVVFDAADYAGYFDGNVEIQNGTLVIPGGQVLPGSDVNLKTDINLITNANEMLEDLLPKSFYYDSTKYFLSNSTQKQYGLIAQDVEQFFPELVSTFSVMDKRDSIGNIVGNGGTYKNLNYNAFISILIKANQEQNVTIDSLKTVNQSFESRLLNIEAMINSCCQSGARTAAPNVSQMDVELSDKDIVVLNQNVPNPFAEQTTITYTIPEKAGFAQLIFNDMKGQIIKVVDIKSKGKGQLNVFANDLSTGMYTYSLYVDGKLVDTKKMVKTE